MDLPFCWFPIFKPLQLAWGKPVVDRVGLIIEIFNAHAQTKEAKLQVNLNFSAIFLFLLCK